MGDFGLPFFVCIAVGRSRGLCAPAPQASPAVFFITLRRKTLQFYLDTAPDYDIDNEHRTVGVTIYGKMIDEKYTNLLKANNTLSIMECLWLDSVQKHRPITKEAAKHLYNKGLIEGRHPHYTISLKVAKMTKQIGHYTKEKGLSENSVIKLLLQLAHNAGSMGFKRKDAYEGLQHVLPSSLSHDEKLRKIGNLLRKIAQDGLIVKSGTGKQWLITTKGEDEFCN